MAGNDEPTLDEITEALRNMENGDALAFPNGGLAYRNGDGQWEITLPEDKQAFDDLSADADAEEARLTEKAFRDVLRGGELCARKGQEKQPAILTRQSRMGQ